MQSPLAQEPETATPTAPGPVASFIPFVVLGGGVGVLAGFAVPLLGGMVPWAVANAIITVASTLLCTELHARCTFRRGRGAGWREHCQSAGAATAAYALTSVAVSVLHVVQPSPSMLTEQIVYLGASGLAGTGRFIVLRLYVFTTRPEKQPGTTAAPVMLAA
ncbi:GtrA family protein [Streptomyces griseus]|uniref:GtrA family protein n=1 Tax=Streptomyces griseus TaxID=1911 RepID=UPI00055B33C5|nr:GtrA family protein [Streptomyces griseus]